MARLKKAPAASPWIQESEELQLANGTFAIRWKNTDTGEVRLIPADLTPDDQPLVAQAQPFEDDPADEESPVDRLVTLLQHSSGERAELKVYRVAQGALEYCVSYSPSEFEEGNFELLRQRFGPGEFELRLYATNPASGKFVVRSKTRLKIAEDKASAAPAAGLPAGLSQVLATIAQGQQQMLDALVQMKQQPQKDPMDEMQRMLAMMTTFRAAMGLDAQPKQQSSIGEIVSAIRELRAASDEIAPEKEAPDSLMGMLPKVLDIVSAGQQQQAAQPAMIDPSQMSLPGVAIPPSFADPVPPVPNPHPLQNTDSEEDLKITTMLKLKSYLNVLIEMAKRDAPVETGARFVEEKIPDDLIDIMELEQWFDLLANVAPEVRAHEAWLRAVRDKALALLNEPEGE